MGYRWLDAVLKKTINILTPEEALKLNEGFLHAMMSGSASAFVSPIPDCILRRRFFIFMSTVSKRLLQVVHEIEKNRMEIAKDNDIRTTETIFRASYSQLRIGRFPRKQHSFQFLGKNKGIKLANSVIIPPETDANGRVTYIPSFHRITNLKQMRATHTILVKVLHHDALDLVFGYAQERVS
jgi:hypothetical protein